MIYAAAHTYIYSNIDIYACFWVCANFELEN
jgi:hypothetical protein